MGLFGNSDPEERINHSLKHIRDLYGEILNIERKVAQDVSVFFNFQHREDRLRKEITAREHMRKIERVKHGKAIMHREHKILHQEKDMLDDIRGRLHKVSKLVHRQVHAIEKIERSL